MAMVTKGLLVRLHAAHGKREELAQFLKDGEALVQQEAGTAAWFAVQFGRHEFGIFDAFADETGRNAHLDGTLAHQLMAQAKALLDEPPQLLPVDVLACKLPETRPALANTRGALLRFTGKPDNLGAVEEFLEAGRGLVADEPETAAWFALRLPLGEYSVFDVFPDNGGRLRHLAGRVPQELLTHGIEVLGSIPELELCSVLAEKLGSEVLAAKLAHN
jgi:quinol monooxygenase YgiN